jgi:hypothetical protein
MISEEVDKCIEYLNNEVSGLSLDTEETGDIAKRWFPSNLSWKEWLVKYETDASLAGADCYKIRVITESYVESVYPFTIHFWAALRVDTFIEFKNRFLYALELLTKARQQQAECFAEWKKRQIKKAAEGFEA